MTAQFKFFYDFMSPLSRSLYILFERNKISCEKIPVALRKGENLTEKFAREVNRFQKLPVIHDPDGFRLAETVAIYHYLGRKNIIPEEWYPKRDVRKLAKIEEFLSWNHNILFISVGKIYVEEFVQLFWDVDPIHHAMLVSWKKTVKYTLIDDSLKQLEKIWLKDTKFLIDDHPTYAELIASCVLMQVLGLKIYELDKTKYPKIDAWLKNTRNYFNPEFDEAHKIICKIGERFTQKL